MAQHTSLTCVLTSRHQESPSDSLRVRQTEGSHFLIPVAVCVVNSHWIGRIQLDSRWLDVCIHSNRLSMDCGYHALGHFYLFICSQGFLFSQCHVRMYVVCSAFYEFYVNEVTSYLRL